MITTAIGAKHEIINPLPYELAISASKIDHFMAIVLVSDIFCFSILIRSYKNNRKKKCNYSAIFYSKITKKDLTWFFIKKVKMQWSPEVFAYGA